MLQIQLEQFEGPLGLLLYLIRKEEMDIYDIPIQTIAQQYLEYIRQMKQIDLEKAGDFIAMAATLIQIKAKMLLPSYDEDGEEIENEDPRKPLVQRLLEYQKFQDAGKQLYDRPLLNRDVWKRGGKEEVPQEEGDLVIEENALFALISMYRKVIRSAQKSTHKVAAKLQSIAQRILEIKEYLPVGTRRELRELVNEDITNEKAMRKLIITFLSGLELGKLGFVKLFQREVCGPLYIEARKEITGDIISQVEEFEYEVNENQGALEQITLTEEDEKEALANDAKIEEDQLQLKISQEVQEVEVAGNEDSATDEEIAEAELELVEKYGEEVLEEMSEGSLQLLEEVEDTGKLDLHKTDLNIVEENVVNFTRPDLEFIEGLTEEDKKESTIDLVDTEENDRESDLEI